MSHHQHDRNFDAIADHFAKKVYGGLKGQIRLAVLSHDISQTVKILTKKLNRPLRVLDVGAGLAQISLGLAQQGHHCTINDISGNLLNMARQNAFDLGIDTVNLRFIHCPYQQLSKKITGEQFDLILCHAVLEWLDKPEDIMGFFDDHLHPDGALSLCFYNPASKIYRNLVMGNFHHLNTPKPADNKSLTPNHPVEPTKVSDWLNRHHYTIRLKSGIRNFSDYTPLKRGGLANTEDVIAMELKYSRQEPFCRMGRYLHIIATKDDE
ncbi:methyltransferase domain-containing protein [Moraxella nasovis]|uniref:methyltransferase domain-containing protein n=1 Tax=Moraxella nasovis TaxID=2904121 RepID=UPI001F616644|nr:methyltransferase domain-containing protein [Moraxella nasovis]UNU73678.1 methyltransferase domain-containing protein [Moraxella nasovis]